MIGALSPYTKKLRTQFPGQGTYLGCRFDPWLGVHTRGSLIEVCFSVSFSLPLFLKSMKKSSGEDFKIIINKRTAILNFLSVLGRGVCVCVCDREREGESEREGDIDLVIKFRVVASLRKHTEEFGFFLR